MEEKILSLLERVCGTDEVRNERDMNLFEAGILDSLGVIELLVGAEELGIKIEPTEIERTDTDTPAKIIAAFSKRVAG